MYEEAYVLQHCACNLWVLMTVLHECSARSNMQTQSCMDTMLVRTSELAEVTIEPGDSSRNPWDGGAGQGWTRQA